MGRRLFVGSLSWNTDDDSLRAAFERFGAVEDAKVITDRETGRSRGFGFVTFEDEAAAQTAIQEMNNSELDGRTLVVNEAQERAPRGGGGGGGGFGGGGGGRGGGGGGRGGGGGGRGGGGGGGGRGGADILDQWAPLGEYTVTLDMGGRKLTQPARITKTQGWSLGAAPQTIR